MKYSRLALIFGLHGQPLVIPPPTDPLPIVRSEDFVVGRKWTWDYSEANGTLYSSETYEVLENKDGVVQIGMSTKFPAHADLSMHHRIEADVNRCLAAYRNPVARKAWSIRLYFWDKDHWLDTGAPTLAFEEKFNCNPHSKASPEQNAALFKQGDRNELFLIPRKGKPDASWFSRTGPEAGIQAEKDFYEKGKLLFRSKLRIEPLPAF